MTQQAIKKAALKRFAEQGYDGTSMAAIAGDVGIKAPAIYAHFKGKTELFLELLDTVLAGELGHADSFLAGAGKTENILLAFLEDVGIRFEKSPDLRFVLNAVYLPPQKLAPQMEKPVQAYMNNMEILINNVFKRLPPCRIPPEKMAAAYMGIMDSIQVEILYGGKQKFRKRLDAFWELFRLAFEQ